jgi:hypothetical protein
MRILLFIPVFILFLSNVPFIERIPLEKAISMLEENGNCSQGKECNRSSENLQSACSMEEPGCDETSTEETCTQSSPEDDCSQKTETSCICITCFQFAASLHVIPEFQFRNFLYSNKAPLFIPGRIKDQFIGAPWQPPDVV